MRCLSLTLALGLAASAANACFAPARDVVAFQAGPACSFESGVTFVGPAYILSNGLKAQTVQSIGYCYEVFYAGTLVLDCDAKDAVLVWNRRQVAAFAEDPRGMAGPSLPVRLTELGEPDFGSIRVHAWTATNDFDHVFQDEDGQQLADPFCACDLTDLPANEQG